jgi:transposase
MILKPEDPNQLEFMCRSELVSEEPLVKTVDDIVNGLDLSGLYSRYSESGRAFYDPGMMLKVLFFGYCDRVRSSRELSRHIRYDIRYRYFCGSLRPDFRTINRFRKDNLDLLGDYFAQIVLFIQELGLIDSSLLSVDGTKLRASANGRGKGRKRAREKLERTFRKQLNADIQAEEGESESCDDDHSSGDGSPYGDVADPDARYMKTRDGSIRLSYNSQVVVDRNQVIIAADVSNRVDDSVQFESMLEQSRENLGGEIDKVAADGGYYSGANLKYACKEGIDLYLPVTKTGRVPDERFHRDEFVYESESDSYRCPGGQHLPYRRTRKHRGVTVRIYRGKTDSCGCCKLRPQCTRKLVRELCISEHYEYERAMKVKLGTGMGRFVYAQRKCLVEPVFGNIKFNLGFARYALRGLAKVRGEFLLICIAHNLKKLAALWCERPLTGAANKAIYRLIWLFRIIIWLIFPFPESKFEYA